MWREMSLQNSEWDLLGSGTCRRQRGAGGVGQPTQEYGGVTLVQEEGFMIPHHAKKQKDISMREGGRWWHCQEGGDAQGTGLCPKNSPPPHHVSFLFAPLWSCFSSVFIMVPFLSCMTAIGTSSNACSLPVVSPPLYPASCTRLGVFLMSPCALPLPTSEKHVGGEVGNDKFRRAKHQRFLHGGIVSVRILGPSFFSEEHTNRAVMNTWTLQRRMKRRHPGGENAIKQADIVEKRTRAALVSHVVANGRLPVFYERCD